MTGVGSIMGATAASDVRLKKIFSILVNMKKDLAFTNGIGMMTQKLWV